MRLNTLIFLFALGVACLWFFGRTPPVQEVAYDRSGARMETCPECGGFGAKLSQKDCEKCAGTGKGEWRLKDSRAAGGPVCPVCRGQGKLSAVRVQCATCQGQGAVSASTKAARRTVKELPSLWERTLQKCFIPTKQNPAPTQTWLKRYPLVDAYLDLRFQDNEWRMFGRPHFEDENGTWVGVATVEAPGADGVPRRRSIELRVQNREITGARILKD